MIDNISVFLCTNNKFFVILNQIFVILIVIINLDADTLDSVKISKWTASAAAGIAIAFSDIERKTVLSVYTDKDESNKTVIESTAGRSGTITALDLDEDELELDGVTYTISVDFIEEINNGNTNIEMPSVGEVCTLYFDYCGDVAYIDADSAVQMYGFLDRVYKEDGDKPLLFRIFSEDGEWVNGEAASHIKINGTKCKSSSEAYSLLGDSSYYAGIVRYELNSSGRITKLDVASDESKTASYIGYDEERFTKDASYTNARYKSKDSSFAHKYSSELGSTKIFYVPKSNINTDGTLKDQKKVFLATNSYFVNDQNYSVDIFDSDKYYVPKVITITGTTKENYENNMLYVNKCTVGREEDGEDICIITGFLNGTEAEYTIPEDELTVSVKAGDILKVALRAGSNKIRLLVKAATLDENDSSVFNVSRPNVDSGDIHYTFYSGYIYDVDYERKAFMVYTEEMDTLKRFSGTYNILKWDSMKKKFLPGNIMAMYGETTLGRKQRVFVHERAYETKDLVYID